MGLGPVPAVRRLLDRTGVEIRDLELVELNEAFAVQALAVMHELGLSEAITNVHGGAIALGHPIGMTGARIVLTAAIALAQRGHRRYRRRWAHHARGAGPHLHRKGPGTGQSVLDERILIDIKAIVIVQEIEAKRAAKHDPGDNHQSDACGRNDPPFPTIE
jgi:N-methylhydantoinase A/oxoprolinase/acetone carboxylase beta subunit